MSDVDAVDGSPQRHRNVRIRNIYGPAGSYILAFAERLLLAEGVEKLLWGLPNERLIRDLILGGKNDLPISQF